MRPSWGAPLFGQFLAVISLISRVAHSVRQCTVPKVFRVVTLKDAGTYITKLPTAEHSAPEWQAAMEALLLVATLGGPTMFARIGVIRALNRPVERVFNPSASDLCPSGPATNGGISPHRVGKQGGWSCWLLNE
jgi:hypothetical protein